MQFDAISLTVAGLGLTLVGIIATLIAPFLVGGARVHFEVTGTSELPRGGPIGNLNVQIFYAGTALQGYLYSVKAVIRNSGRKDVVSDNFVDPIIVSLNGPYDLLHAGVEAKHGIGESVNIDGRSAKIEWRILKPKECVEIYLIIRSDRSISRRKLEHIVSASVRLRDVKSGKPFGHGLGIARFMAAFSVLVALVLGYVGYISYNPRSSIVSDSSGNLLRLRSTDIGYSVCHVQDRQVYFSNCFEITNEEVVNFVKKADTRDVYVGIRAQALLLILIILAIYSAAFAGFPQFVKMTSRLVDGLYRKGW